MRISLLCIPLRVVQNHGSKWDTSKIGRGFPPAKSRRRLQVSGRFARQPLVFLAPDGHPR